MAKCESKMYVLNRDLLLNDCYMMQYCSMRCSQSVLCRYKNKHKTNSFCCIQEQIHNKYFKNEYKLNRLSKTTAQQLHYFLCPDLSNPIYTVVIAPHTKKL